MSQRQWNELFKMLKGKKLSRKNFIPSKTIFKKNKGEIKKFSDTLREFITSRCDLQKIVKGDL